MNWRARFVSGLLVLLAGLSARPVHAQARGAQEAAALRSIEEIRRTSLAWERRGGPKRGVVDMVCLVPDVPTFLEAIATWDEQHAFPILIDDVDLTFKFLRAFQPARIVRFPRKAPPPPDDRLWLQATTAVARAWTSEDAAGAPAPPGDEILKRIGNTPPGVVLSAPESPMLAGAVALAAGRFQPLIRFDVPKHFDDVLSNDEATAFARTLEDRLADHLTSYRGLGDDCDFITLAGDWPYRYQGPQDEVDSNASIDRFLKANQGPHALDDLIGRSADQRSRWAFAGRLLGDARTSVYRAMCSLFLRPESALLMDTYDAQDPNWTTYSMADAPRQLERAVKVTERHGDQASLKGWHRTFDPINRSDLILINSHGDPRHFHVSDGTASSYDVPISVPTAVLMIHSFSAASPLDTSTIAGRWLANGAFLYYGSMNEPALQSFRTPAFVSALIGSGIPFSAAVRQSYPEPFGRPWRLVYLGDPLYRLATGGTPPRVPLAQFAAAAEWPHYRELPVPAPNASDDDRTLWVLRTSVARLERTKHEGPPLADVMKVLLAVQRGHLNESLISYYDAILCANLLADAQPKVLAERLGRIPTAERSPLVIRNLEACQLALLQRAIAADSFKDALQRWSEVVATSPVRDFLDLVTGRVASLSNSPERKALWLGRLKATARSLHDPQTLAVIEAEVHRNEPPPVKAPDNEKPKPH